MYGQQNGFYNPNFNPYQQNMGAVPDMLNQYKGQYQPMPQMQQNMTQPMQMSNQPQQMPKPTNDIIWVQGEAGAKAYLVAPNNRVVLWDTENRTIYIKSADSNGVPSMQILDFTERNATPPISPENAPKTHECTCGDKFVAKDDFNALKGDFEALSKRFEETAVTQVTKPNKTSKKGDA